MNLYNVLLAAVISLTLTLAVGGSYISFLQKRHFGQQIRVDGPEKHKAKWGIPTMGGIMMIATALIAYGALGHWETPTLIAIFSTVSLALLGFIDDYLKISRKRSLGLGARWKLLGQAAIVFVLGQVAVRYFVVKTAIGIPFLNVELQVSYFYYIFLFFIFAGAANGANLTDGLDGLLTGICSTTFLAYTGIAFLYGLQDLAIFSAAMTGACIGFLWFNCHPAKIFMGDTGSLALGGAIAALAILTKTKLLLALFGGVFVIQCLAVIIQALCVKTYRFFERRLGKVRMTELLGRERVRREGRPFLMAPIHHHFELKGWDENVVVVRFWILSGMMSAVGFTLYYYLYLRAAG